MLNDGFIATTALSSFNNAALYSPFFFVVGLLTLPLLWVVYLYAGNFKTKIGWNNFNLENQVSFWSSLFMALWLMLVGGNYAVIRDGISLLPVVLGCVLFILIAIITQKSIQLNYAVILRNKKMRLFVLFMLILMAAASSCGNLWNVLVQISAVVSGIIVGLVLRKNIAIIPINVFVFTLVAILILMQPEFFRFGQLGNLTIVHLLSMVVVGLFAVTALTTKYVNARKRIHQSAYIKLKWLFRILSLLALVLFVLTESVPIFIGLICVIGASEILTIYHSSKIPDNMPSQSVANLLIWMGIITICPVLSGIGVLYLASNVRRLKFAEFLRLL